MSGTVGGFRKGNCQRLVIERKSDRNQPRIGKTLVGFMDLSLYMLCS